MTFRKASFPLVGAIAVLLLPACVEYLPENDPLQNGGPAATAEAPPGEPPTPPTLAPAGPDAQPPPPTPPPPQAPAGVYDALVAPIALYPDPLLSILLPASTFPDQITAAANYLVQYGDPTQIDRQPWDSSVRALAHYPTVVAWMAQNLPWTQALGNAFASAPGDVMASVQSLRARAQAAGTLVSTPQQQVTSDDGDIAIMPGQPDVIFVPVYDPNVVFDEGGYYDYNGPFINFGDPCPVGVWLDFGFDWRRHRVWQGDPYYRRNGGGQGFGSPPPGSRPWHPPSGNRPAPHFTGSGPRVAPVPRPMPGAPNPPPAHYRLPPQNAGGVYRGPTTGGPAPQPRPRLSPAPISPVTGSYVPRSPAPLVGGEGVRATPPPVQAASAVRYAPAPTSRAAPASAPYGESGSAPAVREVREAPEQRSESSPPATRSAPAHESRPSAPAPAPQSPPPSPSQSNNQPPK